MARATCTVTHCTRMTQTKGYCQAHYNQMNRGAEFTVLPPEKICKFEGCPYPGKYRGHCLTHDKQLQRGETLTPTRAQLQSVERPGLIQSLSPFYTGDPVGDPKKSWGPHVITRSDGDIAKLLASLDREIYHALSSERNREINMDNPDNHTALEDKYEDGMVVIMGHGFMSCFWESEKFHPNTVKVSLGLQHSAIMFHPEAIYFDAEMPTMGTIKYTVGVRDRSKVHCFHKFGNQAPDSIRA